MFSLKEIAYPILFLPFLSRVQKLLEKKYYLNLMKINFY